MPPLLPASALVAQLEPYKKLLGILVRQDCISLAVSNPYLNFAEPLGGLMLRGGRLSERALQRLLSTQQQDIAGYVVGCEVHSGEANQQQQQNTALSTPSGQQQGQTAEQQHAVQQLQAALAKLGWQGGWYGSWCPDAAGAACTVTPVAAPAAVALEPMMRGTQQPQLSLQQQDSMVFHPGSSKVADGQHTSEATASGKPVVASTGSGVQQERCSLGQQFLQHYLESLGSLNTFG